MDLLHDFTWGQLNIFFAELRYVSLYKSLTFQEINNVLNPIILLKFHYPDPSLAMKRGSTASASSAH